MRACVTKDLLRSAEPSEITETESRTRELNYEMKFIWRPGPLSIHHNIPQRSPRKTAPQIPMLTRRLSPPPLPKKALHPFENVRIIGFRTVNRRMAWF